MTEPRFSLTAPEIKRRIKAMRTAVGLNESDVGCVEMAPDGTIRVFAKGETKADQFEDWERRAANG